MTEEQNKPKATLIKHMKGTATQTTAAPETKEPESLRLVEKKKVVVVKKKIVVVRPQARPVEATVNPPESETQPFETQQAAKATPVQSVPDGKSEDRIAKNLLPDAVAPGTVSSSPTVTVTAQPVHEQKVQRNTTAHLGPSTPVVLPPRNLPPVPNQGQTAAAHAEWKSKNPQGASYPSPRPQGSTGYQGRQGSSDVTRTGYQGSRPNYNQVPYNQTGSQSNQASLPGQPNQAGQVLSPTPVPDAPPSTGYQGNRPYSNAGQIERPSGYQGTRPPYDPNRPRTGYQGTRPPYDPSQPRTGYQGTRPPYDPSQPRTGYQGTRPPYDPSQPRTGYQGTRPPYDPNKPRTGYQGTRPPFNSSRPGGPRPPYQGGRPGGFGGPRGPRTGGSGDAPDAISPLNQKTTTKKVFKKKKDDFKKPDRESEKDFHIKRKDSFKANPVPKKIDIMGFLTVSDLAKKMNLKASEIIGKLFKMGMMVTINQQIDSDTASLIASDYDCEVNIVSLYDETLIANEIDKPEDILSRAPIVTIMGHVDHGKTKLLDAIRSTDVASGEYGGITQHIGAYKVSLPGKGDVVFLDTPGHAAFTMMRARGADITDIVVLVVAANDGVMPQTLEAMDHAKAAKVPIIVAINKIDLPEANVERVKQQLSDYGLMPEEWGGSTLYCEISALKKIGIENLLDTILLQAEMLELTANPFTRAEGKVIEARIDQGRGIVATVIIERGTLRQGDNFVAGIYPGKVRAMVDDRGKKIQEAGPATPVEIIGLSDIPGAGDPFQVTENEKQARQVGTKRQELERQGQAKNVKKITLDNVFDKMKDGDIKELNVIIKGDVQGSVEAVQNALEKLSTSDIRLSVLRASAGAIIEDDINLAIASQALVLGFNVRPTPKAQVLAEQEKIEIRKYNIIYDAVDDIRAAMEGMLTPDKKEIVIGKVEVRETFHVPKIGLIAGCYVLDGKIKRNAQINVLRDNIQIYSGKISSLKRFKDDAKDVAAGFECGVGIENYQNLEVGDILEVVDVIEVAKKLKTNE